MKNIYYLVIFRKKSGGGIYGKYISSLNFVKTLYMVPQNIKNRLFKLLYYITALYGFRKKLRNENSGSVVLRGNESLFCLDNNMTNVVLVHHYHPYSSNIFIRYYQIFLEFNLLKKVDKIDKLVVVSRYWKEYYHKEGFKNIDVIYNPFEVEKYYQRSMTEKDNFIKKYGLQGKPIIYLGNPQKEKGTDLAYEMLKSIDAHFVTTGIKNLSLPVKHLELSFDEYLVLLQVSSVGVLMSQIKEGWNRVAHELMLSQTPVIGSGEGGMGELLEEGGQIVCRNPNSLYDLVTELLRDKEKSLKLAKSGYAYAKNFTVEKFQNEWKKCLTTI